MKLLFFIFLIQFCHFLHSQTFSEVDKLTSSNIETWAGFGYAVDIDGSRAVVGAFEENVSIDSEGAAYIFEEIGGVWLETQRITVTDLPVHANFGCAVSISGDYVIIGAEHDDVNGNASGSAYIFELINGTWTEINKLTNGAPNSWFGSAVAIHNDKILVGAYRRNFGRGAAYAYEYNSGNWGLTQILTPVDEWMDDYMGYAVALNDSVAAVSLPGDDSVDDQDVGAVYTYKYSGGSWSHIDTLMASDVTWEFGNAIALYDNKMVVGTEKDSENGFLAGAAYTFEYDGDNWTETQRLTPSDAGEPQWFGSDVDLYENTLLIGAGGDTTNGSGSGAAYIYQYSGGYWIEVNKLLPTDGQGGDDFGRAVAISEGKVIIGAHDNNNNLIDFGYGDSGAAYIFGDITSGIQESENELFQCYPIPNKGSFILELDVNDNNSVLEVYNLSGSMVYGTQLHFKQNKVNIGEMASGYYELLVIQNNMKKRIKMFVY